MSFIATTAITIAACAILLAACGGSGDDDPGPICIDICTEEPLDVTPTAFFPLTATAEAGSTSPTDTTPVPEPSSGEGCFPEKSRVAGDTTEEMTSAGLVRTYIVHIPPGYTGEGRVPLVINLHGYGSNATDQAFYSGFPALADEQGFIVVSPNGSGYPQRWAFPGLGGVDEVAFIGELLDRLESDLCIDASRVYAAGMSNGAAITTFIACGLPGRIAAIGAVAATAGPRSCGTAEPIPIITFRSTEDQCVPYVGGTSACGMRLPVVAAQESIRLWAEHNGCDAEPATAQLTEHVRTTEYENCDGGAGAILYTTEGDGHTWPGAVSVPRLGHVTDEIDATAIMWEFFQAHPLE
jgi:polyhydroxybutyrate depolymerase